MSQVFFDFVKLSLKSSSLWVWLKSKSCDPNPQICRINAVSLPQCLCPCSSDRMIAATFMLYSLMWYLHLHLVIYHCVCAFLWKCVLLHCGWWRQLKSRETVSVKMERGWIMTSVRLWIMVWYNIGLTSSLVLHKVTSVLFWIYDGPGNGPQWLGRLEAEFKDPCFFFYTFFDRKHVVKRWVRLFINSARNKWYQSWFFPH